jgi:hypothetical protein
MTFDENPNSKPAILNPELPISIDNHLSYEAKLTRKDKVKCIYLQEFIKNELIIE